MKTWSARFAVLLVAAAVLAWASPAHAGKKQKPRQVPDTGVDEVIQTTEAANAEVALEQMTSESAEGLELVEHGDGTLSVDLEGRFMHVVVAKPEGGTTCKTGHEAVKQAKGGAKAATPKTPELEVK